MCSNDNKLLTMSMPIHFIGEEDCIGVKNSGGMVTHLINDVEISCMPKDLPEHIELNVSNLDLNESLHLTDIKLPEGVNITALMHDDEIDHDLAVVSVMASRVEVEEEDEAADTEDALSETDAADSSADTEEQE